MTSNGSANICDEFRRRLKDEWKQKPYCRVHQKQRQCDCGQSFYLTESLKKWMVTEDVGSTANCRRLLDATELIKYGPPDVDKIYAGNRPSILVFSILLKLNYEALICLFDAAGINDASLRSSVYDNEELRRWLNLPNVRTHVSKQFGDGSLDNILRKFDQVKWRFLVVPLTFGMDEQIQDYRPMPWCALKPVNHGGQAQVLHVAANEEFVSDEIKARLGKEPFEIESYGKCFEFAIKTFAVDSFTDAADAGWVAFQTEKAALAGISGLSKRTGVLEFFGSYTHQDPQGNKTYNILLEFASTDLDQYLRDEFAPQTAVDIIRQWKSVCDVAHAIKTVHNLDNGSDAYRGVHGDVKPHNILLVQDEWKLADFGFAGFRQDHGTDSSGKIRVDGGTKTYGAPEVSQGNGDRVTQTVDTWSFGCVLLLMATWVVLGANGIVQFRQLRQNAHDDDSDAFHDGSDVLPDIKKWMRHLIETRRRIDETTPAILDLVEHEMLVRDPKSRPSMETLCQKLDYIMTGKHGSLPGNASNGKDWMEEAIDSVLKALEDAEEARKITEIYQRIESSSSLSDQIETEHPLSSAHYRKQMLSRNRSSLVRKAPNLMVPSADAENEPNSTDSIQPTGVENGTPPTEGCLAQRIKRYELLPQPPTFDGNGSKKEANTNVDNQLDSFDIDESDKFRPSANGKPPSGAVKASIPDISIWDVFLDKADSLPKLIKIILELNPGAAGSVNPDGQTPIMLAIKRQKIPVIDLLLPFLTESLERDSSKQILEHVDLEGKTVLHYLIKWMPPEPPDSERFLGLLQRVIGTIKSQPKEIINQVDSSGHSPLWQCVESNKVQAARILLDSGSRFQVGETDVFFVAIEHKKPKMLELFLKHAGGQSIDVGSYLIGPSAPKGNIRAILKKHLQRSQG